MPWPTYSGSCTLRNDPDWRLFGWCWSIPGDVNDHLTDLLASKVITDQALSQLSPGQRNILCNTGIFQSIKSGALSVAYVMRHIKSHSQDDPGKIVSDLMYYVATLNNRSPSIK